jgi:predicted XRE-type DNA-binding protein
MRNARKANIHRSGTNVFADLGLPDAETHLAKAELVSRMMNIVKARKLTQTETARIIRLAQSDISNLIRGRFRGYSISRLKGFLLALDQDTEIAIKNKPKGRTGGA